MNHTSPLITLLLLCAFPFSAAAQDRTPELSAERIKEIQAQRSAFITAELALTPAEAQQFWPVYNEMSAKRDALRKEERSIYRSARKEGQELNVQEAEDILTRSIAIKQKGLDLEKTYMEQFKKAIGAVKTVALEKAEKDFHREVLKKYRERMEGRKGSDPSKGVR